ncbi:MAG: hypothetical protein KC464_32930, partial [Myxococcales bacterium]|nr:hypothetical protein [Myxococcales bacterium]
VVEATVTAAGDCLTLPVRATVDAGSVQLGGAAARDVVVDAGAQTMTACGAGWDVGATVTLEADLTVALETWGGSQVGYSISDDANRGHFYYLVSWVGGCDRFGPCDHAPDVFARYRFTITHPADVTVLCPGTVTAGATETTCEFDHDGGPTYSTFGVVASNDWDVSALGTWDGVAVTAYNRRGSGVVGRIDAASQTAFLAWMRQTFGAFPYGDELRLVTGPTYWLGFEHPGNIVLLDTLDRQLNPAYRDPVNHTLTHELAHQWAGDQTTLADTYDFVWKESMAEYLAFVHEDTLDAATAQRTALAWKSFAVGAAFYPVPEEHPPLLDYYGEVYGPGPMILFRQLEALASRDAVIAALQELLGRPHAISVADVRAALEDTTGLDLGGYFDRWAIGTGAPTWPTFEVTTEDQGGGAIAVTVRQATPTDALYGCAFAVELDGANPDERAEVWIDLGVDGTAQVTEVAQGVTFAVTGTVLDPHGSCLAYPATAAAAPAPAPRGLVGSLPRARPQPPARGLDLRGHG